MKKSEINEIQRLISRAVKANAFPGAVVLVKIASKTLIHKAIGFSSIYPIKSRTSLDTVFDLASVTKALATTTAFLILLESRKITLDTRVSDVLPQFIVRENISMKHLLTHTSGLPAWSDFYLRHDDSDSIIDEICKEIKLENPPGSRAVYSDIGFILLGRVIEEKTGTRLDKFVSENIFEPLGMRNTCFNPPRSMKKKIASTEFSNFRFRFLKGEVHDENAYAMKGISGHAGLFSNAHDLSIFGSSILNSLKERKNSFIPNILSSETLRMMTKNQISYFGLGWWTKTTETPNVGNLSPSAFGHNGYTGTSIWIDPGLDLVIIFLSNRVHPVREGRYQEDKSTGIMMERRANWRDTLVEFHNKIAGPLAGDGEFILPRTTSLFAPVAEGTFPGNLRTFR